MKTKKSFPRIFTLVCVLEIPLIRHQENSQDFFKKTFLTWSKKCEIYERMVEFDVRRNLHICEQVCAIPATQKNLDAENLQQLWRWKDETIRKICPR